MPTGSGPPSLRNVLHTGPWGHAGAFTDLDAFLRHHADPEGAWPEYRRSTVLPDLKTAKDDFAALSEEESAAIAGAVSRSPVELSQADIQALIAFLETLTDPVVLEGRLGIPPAVPSGLTVDR